MKKHWRLPFRTRILAIDDEVGFTRLFELAAHHYDIRTESDPQRALETAAEFHPDLILLDRYMPKMSGDVLARSFKAHPKLRKIPIAFVTASVPRDSDGQYCTHLNGYPVLMKPVSLEQIDQCVKECVKGSG
jgi:CheY-like chemotaxis protein